MICRLVLENYKAFASRTEIDFCANRNIKRLDYNYVGVNGKHILKTVGVYGPNNVGKSCLLGAFHALRSLMLNKNRENLENVFLTQSGTTSFEVEYMIHNRFYVYSLDYDNKNKAYLSEKLLLRTYSSNSSKSDILFDKNGDKLHWVDMPRNLKNGKIKGLFSSSFPFMMMFNDDDNALMKQAKEDYVAFAESISFIKMDNDVPMSKTLDLLRNNEKAARFIKEFVKNCDLHIDDFGLNEVFESDIDIETPLEIAMKDPSFSKERLKLFSRHNGYKVPSVLFDSLGTMKLVALAGYIFEALNGGNILVVDEIDSSLHHLLTKSIIAMFSNLLNDKSQLLFSTHDILLLDTRSLLRKDQIYLVDVVDAASSGLTRLSFFTSRSDKGIRGDEDIKEYYLKGHFGHIPSPDLFSSLEEAIGDE